MSSSIELINPKAESVRRAAALQVTQFFLSLIEERVCSPA
jgi:T-complex protein 1 subunit zeta